MINNSTWTAQTLKDYVSSHFANTNVTDDNIKLGLNFFLSLVGRAKRQALKTLDQGLASAIDTTNGYDLGLITDLGSLVDGFEVYRGTIKPQHQLPNVKRGDTRAGYYLVGDTLFTTDDDTVSIIYQKKTPRITTEALSDYTIPIDQDLEQTLFRYVSSFFFEGQFQFDMSQMNEEKFYAEVLQFFSQPTKTRIIQ